MGCSRVLAGAVLAACIASTHAELVIGQTAGLSGPAAASVKELNAGARLYLDEVNRRGGVHGEQIRLVQLDDRNDPALSPGNARRLIDEHQALVLFLSRGTPHTQGILPLLAEHQIAFVAPSTGAMALREPVNPHVFNVRASYQREAQQTVEHLASIGLERIALLHVDDSFGEDAAAGARKGFEVRRLRPVVLETFDRARLDFERGIALIVGAR